MSDKDESPCQQSMDVQNWFNDFAIDEEKRAMICFREVLLISLKVEFAKNTRPIGHYLITVESFGPRNYEFLINVSSSMKFDDYFGGSSVIGSITDKLKCLDEKRKEYLTKEDHFNEKSLYMGLGDNSYHVKTENSCTCNKVEQTKDVPFHFDSSMISEAASVLLIRYLAITDYNGKLNFDCVTIDGEIRVCEYHCAAAKKMRFNDHVLSVYTVERLIYNNEQIEQKSKTFLKRNGKILKHEWSNVQYFLHVNPLIDPTKDDKNNKVIVSIPLRNCWMDDIEMMSKYLDMKSCESNELKKYLFDHPEIKQLIADYTQALLTVKPVNVLDFTIQHFKAFAKDPDNIERISLDDKKDEFFDSYSLHDFEEECDNPKFCTDCKTLPQID